MLSMTPASGMQRYVIYEVPVKSLSILMIIQTGLSCKWTNDSQRFLLEHFDVICDSPSQIYHSALPLCPSSSWIQTCYSAELSREVKIVKQPYAEWGVYFRTATFNEMKGSISCRNNTIAIGLLTGSHDIIILDAITGSQRAIFSGHTESVFAVGFSSDGRLLVSGSDDKTIKLWDMQTGGVIKTFCGHTGYVRSVSISADCIRIVSGFFDGTISLWNIQTGECQNLIKLKERIESVSFSSTDSKYLTSFCDNKVQHWDINGCETGPSYSGSCIAFSSDYTQFMLCNENRVTVQKSGSEVILAEFHVPCKWIKCCCFSPDGRLVAVASGSDVYVWNIVNLVPQLVTVFTDHLGDCPLLVFSSPSSLISSGVDKCVKFWQVGASSTNQVATDLGSTVSTPPSIQFVSLQAKDGIAISGDSNGLVNIWDMSTGLFKTSFKTPFWGNFMGDAQLTDGQLVFIRGGKGDCLVWDSDKCQPSQILELCDCYRLRISGDGSKVFSLSLGQENYQIQAWAMWTWKLVGEVEIGWHQHDLDSFHGDGSKLWVQDQELMPKGWNFETLGSPPTCHENAAWFSLNFSLFQVSLHSLTYREVIANSLHSLPQFHSRESSQA